MPVIKDQSKRDLWAQKIYGCTHSEAREINGGRKLREPGTVCNAYASQMYAAAKRGVGWEISLREWCEVWKASGHFDRRGVGIGSYCMARFGDAGPYKVGNVEIILSTKNGADSIRLMHVEGRMNTAKLLKRPLGSGRGWTYAKGGYQVMVGRKYIGRFSSQELAELAYSDACSHLVTPFLVGVAR